MNATPSDDTAPYVMTIRFAPEYRNRLRFAALVRDTTINDLVATAVGVFLVGVESSADYRQMVEILRATVKPAPQPEAYGRHVESDAEPGICRNCGAFTADGHCSHPNAPKAGDPR